MRSVVFFIVLILSSFGASAEPTIEQIVKFRLEFIPEQLQDPTRASRFIASEPPNSIQVDKSTFNGAMFKEVAQSSNNVAVAVSKGDLLATSFNYQAGPDTPFFAYSVTKFIIGFLVADQICAGVMSYAEKMGDLSPVLAETGYKDADLLAVLDMSSGVYRNASKLTVPSYQEVTRKGVTMVEQFNRRPTPDIASSAPWDYSNFDSNALVFALENATNTTVAKLFDSKIWANIDSEFDGFWLKDSSGITVGAFGLALSSVDFITVGKFIASKIRENECLTSHYGGKGIVVGGDKQGLANWNKHSWKNPSNPVQFGGMGYGGQILVIDLETDAVAFVYSNHNNGYDQNIFRVAWSLLDEVN